MNVPADFPKNNLIGGEWVAGTSATLNINPSDIADVIGEYAEGNSGDVENAVAPARTAFPGWSRLDIQSRHDFLCFVADELYRRTEELGNLLAREEGKTLAEGIYEVKRSAHTFHYYANEVIRSGGERLESVRNGVELETRREALGVVGIITPWNFPVSIPAWKIAPALAYGNCVVFKPAELVPGSAWALSEIIGRSGIPDGVFNLVMGNGPLVGKAIAGHKDVAGLSFTGRRETGMQIAQACTSRLARVQLALGGKNPLVILDDADLEVAINCAVTGSLKSAGQRCTSSSRLIVTNDIHDQFVRKLTERMKALIVDDAREYGTDIGPVVDSRKLGENLDYIDIGITDGAILAIGGKRLKRKTEGYYFEPALFVGATNQMRICRDEILGPIVSVIRVNDYEEALATANDTQFGLSAGICTTSLN